MELPWSWSYDVCTEGVAGVQMSTDFQYKGFVEQGGVKEIEKFADIICEYPLPLRTPSICLQLKLSQDSLLLLKRGGYSGGWSVGQPK